jgi:hypothetical protein
MPSLPPRLSDSQLCARASRPVHAWHVIGLHLSCAAPVRRARVVRARPTITGVPRRHPAFPRRRDDDIR